MAQQDEIIRLLFQIAGEEGVDEIITALRELEAQGGKTEKQAQSMGAGFDRLNVELNQLADTATKAEQFGALSNQLEKTTAALDDAGRVAIKLRLHLGEFEKPTKQMEKAFEDAKKAVKALEQEQESYQRQLDALDADLRSAGVNTADLAGEQARLRTETERTVSALRGQADAVRAQASAAAATKARYAELDDSFRRMAQGSRISADALEQYRQRAQQADAQNKHLADSTERTSSVLGRLKAVALGLFAGLGLREAGRGIASILGLGDAAEKTRIRLAALYGSASEGDRAFDQLRQLARETGQEFDQLVETATRLKSFGLEPLDGTLEALINQNARLGGSMETLNGIVLALGQAQAKQKLQGEEILQLVERGVPVWDLLAQATGKNVQELQKLSEQGKLGRTEIKLLIDEIGRSADGAAASQLGTLSALFQGLRDRVKQFLTEVSNSGALDFFKQQLANLNAQIDQLAASGKLREYAKSVSDAIVGTAQAVQGAVRFVVEYSGALLALGKAYAAIKITGFIADLGISSAKMLETARSSAALTAATTASGGAVSKFGALLRGLPTAIKVGIATVGVDFALSQVSRMIQVLGELRDINALNAQAEIDLGNQRDAMAAKIAKLKEEFKGYADVAIASTEELGTKTQDQADAYVLQLERASQYFRALELEQKALGNAQGVRDARARVEELGRAIIAAKARSEEAGAAMVKASTRFGEFARKAADEFDKLSQKGIGAGRAIEGVFKNLDLSTVKGLKDAAQTVELISVRGKEAAAAVRDELRQQVLALSDQEFQKLRASMKTAFGDGDAGAKALRDTLSTITLERLGVDIEAIKTGFSDAGASAVENFGNAVKEIEGLGLTAQQQSQAVAQAFDAAFAQASTKSEIEALKTQLNTAFNAGKISVEEYTKRIEQAEAKLRALAGQAEASGNRAAAAFGGAAGAVQNLADEADAAGASVSIIGDRARSAGEDIRDFSTQYQREAAAMGDVSEKFAQQAAKNLQLLIQGGESGRFAIDRQNAALAEQTRELQRINFELDEQIARYDPMAQKLNQLRDRFDTVGDGLIQETARKQERLDQLREQQQRDLDDQVRTLKRERELIEAAASRPQREREIIFRVIVENSAKGPEVALSPQQINDIAYRVVEELERGGVNAGT